MARELKKTLPYIDLFHYDIKAMDKQLHLEHSGADNENILNNLDLICQHGKSVILRCPIIPGVNDNDAHLAGIAELANRHPSIERIDLLPYHAMGAKKEAQMNQDQSPLIFPTPSKDEKQLWLEILRKYTDKAVNLGN
jgi:pyruvate-formate lyase-activating enzyme